jgi:4-hydroxybenzoate polyprenyltransferase
MLYVAGLVVLPPYVWSALGSFRDEFLLLYPVALPLALAVHLANALPDVENDRESGRAGLVATIGRGAALILLYVSLETPVILALASLLWLSYDTVLFAGTLVTYIALELIAAYFYTRRPFEAGARLAFRPLVAGCVVFVAGLLAAV